MTIQVQFWSYFKELTGHATHELHLATGATLNDALEALRAEFPKLEPMRQSTLAAVGVDYQKGDYPLSDGETISLFPPVQGG